MLPSISALSSSSVSTSYLSFIHHHLQSRSYFHTSLSFTSLSPNASIHLPPLLKPLCQIFNENGIQIYVQLHVLLSSLTLPTTTANSHIMITMSKLGIQKLKAFTTQINLLELRIVLDALKFPEWFESI